MNTLVKLTIAITLSLFGLTEANAQWGNKKVVGSGNVTTKTISTGDYSGVKGVGSMDITLVKGTEGNITVKTDDNLHEYVIIEVKDNTLIVKTKKNMYLKTKKGIHVTVPFNSISKVALVGSGDIVSQDTVQSEDLKVSITGSGDVELSVEANTLRASVTGSGDVSLAGSTRDLDVTVTGSGDFSGFALDAQNTEVTVSGSGDASVMAKNSLRARVSGSGDIEYKGNPEKRDTKTSGSGEISGY